MLDLSAVLLLPQAGSQNEDLPGIISTFALETALLKLFLPDSIVQVAAGWCYIKNKTTLEHTLT